MKKLFAIAFTLAITLNLVPVSLAESPSIEAVSQVESINLSTTKTSEVEWSTNGEAKYGVKVVYSLQEKPTYPPREGDKVIYIGDSQKTSTYLKGFAGEDTYYVRVCEYLNGDCGTYSNQISLELAAKEDSYPEGKEEYRTKFSDLSTKYENYDAIEYLRAKSVVKGYQDGTFRPENRINRAEFLKIAMELSSHTPEGENCFTDVQDQWFAPYICKASELGLVKGYQDGSFKPEQNINFAEASKIIVNTLALETNDSSDEDWFQKYVESMEVLSAIPSTINAFDKKITRGEMAEMMYRIDGKKYTKKSRSYRELKGEKTDYQKSEESQRESTITSINLSNLEEGKVAWRTEGESPLGYKVVYSLQEKPTYPPRDGDQAIYQGDIKSKNAYLKPFDGEGVYYVRVCDYLGDSCGTYSNQIQVNLTK